MKGPILEHIALGNLAAAGKQLWVGTWLQFLVNDLMSWSSLLKMFNLSRFRGEKFACNLMKITHWILIVSIFGAIEARAQLTGIYTPPGSHFVDGNSSFDGSPGYGFQQIFLAEWFSDLPKGGGVIKQVIFRSDASIFGQKNWAGSVTGVEIGVSTIQKSTTSLASIFAQNVGADRTLLSKTTDVSFVANLPSGSGHASEFSLSFGSNKDGFFYDPSAGNLLLDIRGLGFPFALDAYTSAENVSVTFSSLDHSFSQGKSVQKGLVVLFAFYPVPEPTPLALFALGVFGFVITRKHRHLSPFSKS